VILEFALDNADVRVPVDVRDVVAAGYTGRDQDAVRQHVAELQAHGVPAPPRVPTFYRVTPDRLTLAPRIAVLGRETSGEAEFALFRADGTTYVAAASDHTDRALQRLSVAAAKQAAQKVLSPDAWRLDDVRERWDAIALRSWSGGSAYQDGVLGQILPPEEIVSRTLERIGADTWPEGLVILSGTVGLIRDLEFGDRFAVELSDAAGGRSLRLEYHVDAVDVLD
jgi:hypothetical protein